MMETKDFYNSLADYYDNMIDFDKNLSNRTAVLSKFKESNYTAAVDVGCGSGVDSIALSKLGLQVTAYDISEIMINKAKENAVKYNSNINFILSDVADLTLSNNIDLIISLGNSLANVHPLHFKSFLHKAFNALNNGGRLIFQILNYSKILKNKERIVNITEDSNCYYIRFYDFLESTLVFNILSFFKKDKQKNSLISSIIYPYILDEVKEYLLEAGFENINFYSNFDMHNFDADSSKDLIVITNK